MKNMGDGRRVAKVANEVQRIVAQYVVGHMRGELQGIVTISRVLMPADLRTAKVYVSAMGDGADLSQNLETLQERAPDIQSYISKHLKMRYCPKLTFYKDDVTEHIIKVDRILHDLEVERTGREKKAEVDSDDDHDSE